MSSSHFKGKTVPEHLREARLKGASVQREMHGIDIPSYLFAFFDSLREIAVYLFIFWAIMHQIHLSASQFQFALISFILGFAVWKWSRSALLGYARLQRLHRLIEEERYEIAHHREQEKEELREMYKAKGFSGSLLDQVVDVLMADDNRLLQVMLEEELGLTLESFEHPLKQGFWAFLGIILGGGVSYLFFLFIPYYGILIGASLVCFFSGIFVAKKEKNLLIPSAVWNLATCILSGYISFFLMHFLIKLFE